MGQKDGNEASEKQKKYVCSMEPWILRDEPGTCPICGMALIEKGDQDFSTRDTTLDHVVCSVNEKVLAHVQTVSPVEEELPIVIEAIGNINYDPRKVNMVCAHYSGRIEKSYVKYKFQPISKGQKLYEIYCPEIYTAKMNYITVLKKYPEQKALVADALKWLILLGLTDEQIKKVSSNQDLDYHLSVYSDADGYAVSADFDPEQEFNSENNGNFPDGGNLSGKSAAVLSEGLLVENGTPLFKVINTANVRVDLKVRTEDAGLLKKGQKVTITDILSPEQKYIATISQVEPLQGGAFQLVKVYLTDNSKTLVPGKQIQAQIELKKRNSYWVPKSSIANLGLQQIVFVMQDGTLIATKVKTGLQSNNKIELKSGVDKNARIALNASLLIDSDGFIKVYSK